MVYYNFESLSLLTFRNDMATNVNWIEEKKNFVFAKSVSESYSHPDLLVLLSVHSNVGNPECPYSFEIHKYHK